MAEASVLPQFKFKLVLVGDDGVGKTTFVKRHLTGEFDLRYIVTLRTEVFPIRFITNLGVITFDVFDTAGQATQRTPEMDSEDGFYTGGQCGIIMYDVTSRITYKNVPTWHSEIEQSCTEIPIVLCANKVDVMNRSVKTSAVTFHHKKNLHYCEISVKSKSNLEKPFLWLARMLMGRDDLVFADQPLNEPGEDDTVRANNHNEVKQTGDPPFVVIL